VRLPHRGQMPPKRTAGARAPIHAGVALTEDVRPCVVQLSTGAWYDPDPGDPSFCRHGNPNVLTAGRPSSALSQGTTGQLAT
jgi:biotin/methionine sulfoxide reductase